MKYLIEDDNIKICLGSSLPPNAFTEAFTQVVYNLMYKLPRGFYLPEGYIVLPPGAKISVNLHDYSKKVYVVDPETGIKYENQTLNAPSNFQIPLKFNTEQRTIEPPYDLVIAVFDKGDLKGEYTLHVRNYAVFVYIQAFQFLYYIYLPLYAWYMKQLGFSPISLKDAIEDEIGNLLALPLEKFPISSSLNLLQDIEDYYMFSNPLEAIIPEINLAKTVWNAVQDSSMSLEEKFSYIFNFSVIYGQYKKAVSSSSPVVASKYLFELLKHVLILLKEYYSSLAIQGFGATIVPKVSLPQFFTLPFDGGQGVVDIPTTWNFARASYIDKEFMEEGGKISISVPSSSGYFVFYYDGDLNQIDINSSVEIPDFYRLFYNFGYLFPNNSSGTMKETDFIFAYYPQDGGSSYERTVFFPNLVTYVNYVDNFYGVVTPRSSGEIKILPLYPDAFKLGEDDNPFFDGSFAPINTKHDLPFDYFISSGVSVMSASQNSILFKNSEDNYNGGSQFILTDLDVAGVQWVMFVHLYLDQDYDFEGNSITHDRNLLSSFLNFIDLFSRDFFGALEVWITPYVYIDDTSMGHKVKFDETLYNTTCERSGRQKNMNLFWGLPLKEWLNVWS